MRHYAIPPALTLAAMVLPALPALAGQADVLAVKVFRTGGTEYIFHVTVEHADTGWEHYADAWRVVGPDGTVFGTRSLQHPHVDEQPFTRSMPGVKIPRGVTAVRVEGHDNVHGWGGATVEVELPR